METTTNYVKIFRRKFRISLLVTAIAFTTQAFSTNVTLQAHGGVFPTYPKIDYSCAYDRSLIDKGEYLAKMGDCIACHTNTKEGGEPYAGGLPFDTPFGIFYSQNISPDKQTGIGNWTEAEFARAIREGISPKGDNYYPVLPYVYFNRLNDEDAKALFAYLRCIPAVKQQNRANQAHFPFNWRFLLSGWKLMFFDFHKGQIEPNPNRSAEWNRGKYIVDGLGHCGMCHTPINIFGAWKYQDNLGGAMVNGFYAPNITSAALGDKSVEEITAVFTQNEMMESQPGSLTGSPMSEVNHDSLMYLNQDDLAAIATYLKTVKAVPIPQMATAGSASKIGKQVYEANCSMCHANGAAGAPILGNKADWQPRIAQGMNVLLQHALDGFNAMPAKGNCLTCSDQQIKDAIIYMVDQAESGSSAHYKIAPTVPLPIKNSIAEGKKVYENSCAMCHAENKYGAPVLGDQQAWKPLIAQGVDVLFKHAVHGYGNMPAKGACIPCSNEEIEAAVKYMVQQGATSGDYSLW